MQKGRVAIYLGTVSSRAIAMKKGRVAIYLGSVSDRAIAMQRQEERGYPLVPELCNI